MLAKIFAVEDSSGRVGSAKVSDGPHEKIYGLSACFEAADAAKNNYARSTLDFADCYVVTAKSMFNQP